MNARVGGDAWLDGTRVHNDFGPAVNAEGFSVGGSLLLCRGFTATAESPELGTVHLMSSRVGSRLDLGVGRKDTGDIVEAAAGWEPTENPATLCNKAQNGLVLDLSCATTNDLRLPPEVVCEPEDGWCSTGNKVILVGLKYTTLSRESTHRHWPHLLGHHVDLFDAEPYQHLATVLRGSGRAGEARQLLIELENERHRRRSRPVPTGSSAWHWTKRIVLGHGYKPGRALYFLLGVFGLALLLSLAAWSADWVHRPAIRVEGQELPAASKSQELDHRLRCSIGATVRMAVDLSVPLLNTTGRAGCDFRPNYPPNVIGFVLGLFLQVMGWVFATLFVVGFTGVVRRE
ncbi:hypothetical protein [Saccharothrix luteola]|uniref:hypothetical protein n=1 Tax=Saccharothrix luteola TaxID=2893018 RepID=UPI001E538913|nr:hypothetical protein [Saccharothrix luteola]MCC8242760.1 hypothetical protein [Saccharothrix luteola]